MKTLLTTTAIILAMSTAAMADHDNGNGKSQDHKGEQGETGATGPKGDKGDRGNDGTNGTNGTDGTNGTNGVDGADGIDGANGVDGLNGSDGATGSSGSDGADGRNGSDAVAPLGSLSFAAASASFYGDGMGFGLSNSNYGDLEGSVVFGFDIDGDWHVVAGITTDFKGKTAGSIGLGVSF